MCEGKPAGVKKQKTKKTPKQTVAQTEATDLTLKKSLDPAVVVECRGAFNLISLSKALRANTNTSDTLQQLLHMENFLKICSGTHNPKEHILQPQRDHGFE